ncbi:hypothetical protein ABK040_009866 [Willaertia magna]
MQDFKIEEADEEVIEQPIINTEEKIERDDQEIDEEGELFNMKEDVEVQEEEEETKPLTTTPSEEDEEPIQEASIQNQSSYTLDTPIIDVTNENFEEILDEIKQQLPKVAFISFDLEMTGLEVDDEHKVLFIDTIEDRYTKLKASAKSFEAVQFGLCLWFVVEEKIISQQQTTTVEESRGEELTRLLKQRLAKLSTIPPTTSNNNNSSLVNNGTRLDMKCYNFYLFKKPAGTSRVFSCQNTCLQFLIENRMDFNKVVMEGITYMNEEEEQQLRQNLQRKMKQKLFQNTKKRFGDKIDRSRLTPQQLEFLENTKSRVIEWFENTNELLLDLDPCNSFERKLLFEELNSLYEDKITLSSVYGNGTTYIRVERIAAESQEEKLSRELEEAVNKELGFTRVLREIRKYKQIFYVGHNAMLDFMHVYNKFINPLPEDSETYKIALHKYFEHIVDTKYTVENYPQMASQLGRDTSLRSVFEHVLHNSKPGSPELDFFTNNYNLFQNYSHVAAYDALMTGYIFVKVSHFIGKNRSKYYKSIGNLTHLKEFVNVINLHSSEQNFKIMKENPKQDRSDVFLLTGMTQEITNDTINKAFKKYGPIKIYWLNAKYCFVQLKNRGLLKQCIKDVTNIFLCHNKELKALVIEKGVSVMTYEQAAQGHILSSLSSVGSSNNLEDQEMNPNKRTNVEMDGEEDEQQTRVSRASTSSTFTGATTNRNNTKRTRTTTTTEQLQTSSSNSCVIL